MANKYSLNQIKYRLFASLYGSADGQHRLEKKIKKLQRYLGIGSGGNVKNGGEAKIIEVLKKEKSETIVRLPVLFSVTLYVSNGCKQICSLVSAMVCYRDSEHAFSVRFGLYC